MFNRTFPVEQKIYIIEEEDLGGNSSVAKRVHRRILAERR